MMIVLVVCRTIYFEYKMKDLFRGPDGMYYAKRTKKRLGTYEYKIGNYSACLPNNNFKLLQYNHGAV